MTYQPKPIDTSHMKLPDLGNKDGLAVSLGNQALILYSLGDLDGAMRLHKEQEQICRSLV